MQITEMKAKVNTMDDIKKFVAYLNQFPMMLTFHQLSTS